MLLYILLSIKMIQIITILDFNFFIKQIYKRINDTIAKFNN
jgi:hypothetical protein